MFPILFFLSFVYSINVKDCSDGAGSMYVDQIDIDPDPPKAGVDCTATVQFRVTAYIDTLDCTMTVKKLNIPIYKMSLDFCKALNCPVNVGAYNTSATVPIPSYTPTGSYGLEILCKDSNGKENACAATNVTIAK